MKRRLPASKQTRKQIDAWRVLAANVCGDSSWSSEESFEIVSSPDTLTLEDDTEGGPQGYEVCLKVEAADVTGQGPCEIIGPNGDVTLHMGGRGRVLRRL